MSLWTSRIAPSRHSPARRAARSTIDAGVGGDAVAVERGLRQAPLPAPEVPLAREQPVAEHRPEHPQKAVLLPEPVARDEHVLDEVRMADERHPHRPIARRTTSPCFPRIDRRKASGSRRKRSEFPKNGNPAASGGEASIVPPAYRALSRAARKHAPSAAYLRSAAWAAGGEAARLRSRSSRTKPERCFSAKSPKVSGCTHAARISSDSTIRGPGRLK